MLLIYFITTSPLSTAANIANDIPITQGLDNIVISRDFISGFLLGAAFVFILIGLFKTKES